MTDITELTAEKLEEIRQRYRPTLVPKCHICGVEMTIQRMSARRITYGCSGATYDETGCHYAPGRSIADDHYAESRITVVDTSDPDVLTLVEKLEKAQQRNAEFEAQNEYIRKRYLELDLLIGKNILVMQAAIIEWQATGDAKNGLAWIYNTLFGPGELPDEAEKDAQAYFHRKYAPLDEELMALHKWFWDKSEAENLADSADGKLKEHSKASELSLKKEDRCDVCTEGARGGCGTCIFNGYFE
ncbi:ead/Ea22-like family protein [Klebsiella pneumoniae]|uniref:ead/Ea22-like family protein n=1 Tax=Klebsiella pneumoniae TaxID=573 RepID=UPI00164AF7F7|nr:ead/Ea22-like family protein [Klebsiella pneumoniae]HDS2979960.1 ead/Ea22-like family protein [Klebsiella pneumoniae subsp. pneumoniae]MBC5301403.1 ead/Ea22-like family protein [Klebsiella pneumoniae]MBC5453062.1 ead/Ea22-like family protein [Klebsiella pneumoniae]MBC5469001.1 ead/Ea22-like family protein [Klebsiella pneumoniae]UDC35187.1 ead/Ea22-like family protein [Klebsiella pneumoniae]